MELTNENEQEPIETEGERLASYANEEVELFGVMLGALTENNVTHQAVRSAVLPKIYGLMKEIEEVKQLLQESREHVGELQDSIDYRDELAAKLKAEYYADLSQLKADKHQLELVAEDRATKLDNCYNQLTEAKSTIEDLNAKLTAATAPKTPIRTNLDSVEAVKKEKRAIYDVVEIDHSRYKAKFADNDEKFEDWTIYKDAKYQEVSEEQAHTFRTVQSVEDDKRDLEVASEPIVYPSVENEPCENEPSVDTFREEEETNGSNVVDFAPSVVGSFITEERFQSLEDRVAYIESKLKPRF